MGPRGVLSTHCLLEKFNAHAYLYGAISKHSDDTCNLYPPFVTGLISFAVKLVMLCDVEYNRL